MNTIVQACPDGDAGDALASGDLVAIVTYLRGMKDYGARNVVLGDPARGKAFSKAKAGA